MGTYHKQGAVLGNSVKGELEISPRIPPRESTLFNKYHLGLWVSFPQAAWLEIGKKKGPKELVQEISRNLGMGGEERREADADREAAEEVSEDWDCLP